MPEFPAKISNHIWGDSHAQHLIAGFSEAFKDYNIILAYQSGCVPQSGFLKYVRRYPNEAETNSCIKRNKDALEFLKKQRPSIVVLSNAKRSNPAQIAPSTNFILKELKASGHNAFFLGDFIRPSKMLTECISVPNLIVSDGQIESRCKGDATVARQEMRYNDDLAKLVDPFVNINEVQCPGNRCIFMSKTTPLFRDTHHLSPTGSIRFIRALRDAMPIGAKD